MALKKNPHNILIVYIPENDLEKVKKALFKAGAGTQGNYAECCFQTRGMGQFRPLQGSRPALGRKGQLEKVKEWRVEMLVPVQLTSRVAKALKKAHPYEEPAYHFLQIMNESLAFS